MIEKMDKKAPFQVLPGKVLVEREQVGKKVEGAEGLVKVGKTDLVIPEKARETLYRGDVLGVGPYDSPLWPSSYVEGLVGKTALWKAYAGSEVEVGGSSYVVLDLEDLLGVIGTSEEESP